MISSRFIGFGILFSGLCFVSVSQAQMNPIEHRLERMQEYLELSDEQANSIYVLFSDAQKECSAKEVFSERRDCRHEKRTSVEASLAGILDKEQLEKFQSLKKERRGPPHDPEDIAKRLEKKLGLSDSQTAAIEEVFEKAKKKCGDPQSMSEKRQCRRSQRDDIHEEFKKILTEEQLEEFKELRKQRMGGKGRHGKGTFRGGYGGGFGFQGGGE